MSRSSESEFIAKALAIYGDKFDYSALNFKGVSIVATIRCVEHNRVFEYTPKLHLKRSGCPICMRQGMNLEDFIFLSRQMHGDKFDYSMSKYINVSSRVSLRCVKHDRVFSASAQKHLDTSNHGCPRCSRKYMDTEDFIYLAREKHGDRFNYSKSVYTKFQNKIVVTCMEHGDFITPAGNHLNGSVGCKECIGQMPITVESFIERSKRIHGDDAFDYSMVNEINGAHSSVTLRCIKHDEVFTHNAWSNIQRGRTGCTQCYFNSKLDEKTFLRRAKSAFENIDFFDYSRIDWGAIKNGAQFVEIWCLKHDTFEKQTLYGHLTGRNPCRSCLRRGFSVGERDLGEFVSKVQHVQDNNLTVRLNDRTAIKPREIDVFLPELKLGFEYNGDYWHSDAVVAGRYGITADEYHRMKVDLADAAGITLVFIWESEWKNDRVATERKVLDAINSALITRRSINDKCGKY